MNCTIRVAKAKALISFAVTEADLRLCFRISKNPIFSRRGSYGVTFLSYSSSQVVDAKYNGQGPGSRITSVKQQEYPNDSMVNTGVL